MLLLYLSMYLLFMEHFICSCIIEILSGVISFHPGAGRDASVVMEL